MPGKTSKLNNKDEKPIVGETLTVVGFGKTSEEGPVAKVLQKANVEYQDNSVCSESFGDEFQGTSMMCAGGADTDR